MTDTLVVTPTPAPAAGPKDAELAKKFDDKTAQAAKDAAGANPPPAAEKATKPEWVPEKFWDTEKGEVKTEELAKSYGELEKKGSGRKAGDTTPPPAADADADAAKKIAERAGVDFGALDTEYATDGKLSDASYEKLSEKGFPRDRVDAYIAGVAAQGASLMKAAHDAAGGAEQFAAVQAWAADNASEADLKAYNELIGSGDTAKIAMAVQALTAKHADAEGRQPSRVIAGSGNGSAPGEKYDSRAQMTADMRDPRYKKDPAFRAQVEAKLGRSSVL